MSNPTPLNPDALEAGHEAYRRAYYRAGDSMAQCFEKGLSAYLAVAQPVVNSVELFDAWEAGATYGHNAEGRLIDKLSANPHPNPDRPEVGDA